MDTDLFLYDDDGDDYTPMAPRPLPPLPPLSIRGDDVSPSDDDPFSVQVDRLQQQVRQLRRQHLKRQLELRRQQDLDTSSVDDTKRRRKDSADPRSSSAHQPQKPPPTLRTLIKEVMENFRKDIEGILRTNSNYTVQEKELFMTCVNMYIDNINTDIRFNIKFYNNLVRFTKNFIETRLDKDQLRQIHEPNRGFTREFIINIKQIISPQKQQQRLPSLSSEQKQQRLPSLSFEQKQQRRRKIGHAILVLNGLQSVYNTSFNNIQPLLTVDNPALVSFINGEMTPDKASTFRISCSTKYSQSVMKELDLCYIHIYRSVT